MEHTPTPWYAVEPGNYHPNRSRVIFSRDPGQRSAVAEALCNGYINEGQSQRNAAFIVRACNAHDMLVAAAADALADLEDLDGAELDAGAANDTCHCLRAALRLARGEA